MCDGRGGGRQTNSDGQGVGCGEQRVISQIFNYRSHTDASNKSEKSSSLLKLEVTSEKRLATR
ncbi:MAG TPA: hypothetical protein DER09_02870 [Prolixibacteraceae bacterium]|nr:hypothetical protein [Prolixibacteraceae bacterium]